jgi:hypothetical protein
VRNSSLVECPGADNVARLKQRTEAVDVYVCLYVSMVGERSLGREARPQGLVERREERMPE